MFVIVADVTVVIVFRFALVDGFDFNRDRMFDLPLDHYLDRTNLNASFLPLVTISSSFESTKIKMFSLRVAEASLKWAPDLAG